MLAALLGFVGPAAAQSWTGLISNDWGNALNWSTFPFPPAENGLLLFPGAPNRDIQLTVNRQAGAVTFASEDAYTINGPQLTLTNGLGSVSSNPVTHTINSDLVLADPNLGPVDANIDSSAPIVVNGAVTGSAIGIVGGGTLTLTNNENAFLGTSVISSGALQIGAGGSTGGFAGSILNSGSVIFNRSDDHTHSSTIVGSGAVIKRGEGELTFSGAVAPTGLIRVENGALTIPEGAEVLAAGGLLVDGGTLTIQDFNAFALGPSSTLTARNQASINFLDDYRLEGRLVIESGSRVEADIQSNFTVGREADGSLTVFSGGHLRTSFSTISGSAQARVSGAGSRWDFGALRVGFGFLGNPSLLVDDGGVIDGQMKIALAGNSGSLTGSVTIRGAGSRWTGSAFSEIGAGGTGALVIEQGGQVLDSRASRASFRIGTEDTGDGSVTVDGEGSLLDAGSISVGYLGNGSLIIRDGAQARSSSAWIAAANSSNGTVTVTGAGSEWLVGFNLGMGGFGGDGGPSTLFVKESGRVSVGSALTISTNATVHLDGGELEASRIDHTHGGDFHFTSGILAFDWFQGDLNQSGGTLPLDGGFNDGDTLISGDYTATKGTIVTQLRADDRNTRLRVSGVLTLGEGSSLDVSLVNDYVPRLGDSFEVLRFNSITGGFGAVNLPVLTNGLNWDQRDLYTTGELLVVSSLSGDYNNDGSVDAADYALWRDSVGMPAGTLFNDTDGGVIGQAQYDTWAANYGAVLPLAVAIPEPNAGALLLVSVLIGQGRRK